ncbi:hypothetical protein DFH06DRAFT_1317504 [Mycena polygramma]|nr:hypothetical protein DFH06DRAFT_1317504 [Mycena polygramma]
MSLAAHILLELITTYLCASLIVLAVLTTDLVVLTLLGGFGAAVPSPWAAVTQVPIVQALEITFLCTVVVVAAHMWWYPDACSEGERTRDVDSKKKFVYGREGLDSMV